LDGTGNFGFNSGSGFGILETASERLKAAEDLYSEKFTWIRLNYIHMNPVRAGYVNRPEYWKYSSASNYMEMDGVLENVQRLAPPVNFAV
jgi:hypothetical protein